MDGMPYQYYWSNLVHAYYQETSSDVHVEPFNSVTILIHQTFTLFNSFAHAAVA